MFKRMTAAAAILLIASASAPPDLSAQHGGMHGQRPDSMPGMMGGMMGQGMMGSGMMEMMGQGMGMMATGGPGPTAILRMGDALDLTESQRARLQEIQEEHSRSTTGHMRSAMAAHQEAADALRSDSPDFEAYEDALREAANHMVLAHTGMARAAVEAREVLNAEQREQLQRGMRMMEGMMGQPGMGGGGRPR